MFRSSFHRWVFSFGQCHWLRTLLGSLPPCLVPEDEHHLLLLPPGDAVNHVPIVPHAQVRTICMLDHPFCKNIVRQACLCNGIPLKNCKVQSTPRSTLVMYGGRVRRHCSGSLASARTWKCILDPCAHPVVLNVDIHLNNLDRSFYHRKLNL